MPSEGVPPDSFTSTVAEAQQALWKVPVLLTSALGCERIRVPRDVIERLAGVRRHVAVVEVGLSWKELAHMIFCSSPHT